MKHHLLLSLLTLSAPATAQGFAAYLVDSNLDQLFHVNLNTGAATLIGSTLTGLLGTPAGLTWRPDTQTMWTIDLGTGSVGTINLANAAFTPVFTAVPAAGWQGIDFDIVTGKFYLLNQNLNLYSLDPATGTTTLLGPSGAPLTTALESDANGTMYAIGFAAPGTLYTVNKTTGAFTATVSTTPVNMQGLSFAPNGRLYGANTANDSLYVIDPATGVTTLIGAHGAGVQFAKGFEITTLPAGLPARVVRSGTGCGGLTQNSERPILGTTFNLLVNGIPAGSVTGLELIGLPSGGIDLTGAGMPGCFLYVLPILTALPFGTGSSSASIPLTLPIDASLVGGSVPVQALTVSPSVNPAGIATSDLATLFIGDL